MNGCTVYITTSKGGSYKVFFNGQEITSFTADGGTPGSDFYTASFEDPSFLVDGTWVVVFKEAGGGISWSAMAIGDVAEGNRMVAMGYEDMLEVAIDNGKQYDTLTYEPQDETANMSINVLVKEGYNFRIWFNEMECTDKFANVETLSDGRVRWRFDSSDASIVAPYLQDGRWIILFYDDAERYDLNNDKKVDISDVTKLVNEILNKEQNNNDD